MVLFHLKTMSNNRIPIAKITKGTNPRRKFVPSKMRDLEESIRAQDLLQPILVRPLANGEYQLIAGERRLRSYKVVFGPDSSIPALVREMNDEDAKAAALAENTEREPMTEIEEAEAAATILGDCLGNRTEAARRLGWEPSRLDRRLALMHASDAVRQALQDEKIFLGHAELLAACRKESQDAALAILLTSPKQLTVAELKAYLDTNALHLEHAIFNKDDCAGCHHNSDNQGQLFGEAISTGRCTNKLCFDTKTGAEITSRADALKDEFQVIRIARAGENMTLISLVAEGQKGVGVEQAAACKTCKDFGAVVSAVPDKLGRVFKNMCMNLPCNQKHVAARVMAESQASVKQDAVGTPAEATGAQKGQPTGAATKGSTGATDTTKAPAKASSEPSNRVKEYREEIWRQIFERNIPKLAIADNRMVLLAICLTRPSMLNSLSLSEALDDKVGKGGMMKVTEMLESVSKMDKEAFASALSHIAARVNGAGSPMPIDDVTGVLKFFGIQVAANWRVCKEFFDLLTKNELDAVCEETGIKQAMGPAYAKVRNGGKPEFVTAALAVENFDYVAKIPKLMSY